MEQAKGAVSGQLLLQLEADMLLNLMVRQLTASIPDSYHGAQAAREAAYQLHATPFSRLLHATSLHKLPHLSGYTGPQVALPLLPSPLQPLSLQQQQQRLRAEGQQQQRLRAEGQQQLQQEQRRAEEQQLQQEQPVGWCVLAPTAPLLTELLPLLPHQFLTQLQQNLQQQQHQQREALSDEQPPDTLGVLCYNLQCVASLLVFCIVPASCTTTAATRSPPAAARATGAMEARLNTSQVPYRCVLHAQDAFMTHACDILGIFEAVLRCEAMRCKEAMIAALATAGGVGSSSRAETAASAAATAAGASLHRHGGLWLELCYPKVHGDPPYPSPLVLLALAAGPGSEVQRQLHSLLATMVKLSRWDMLGHDDRMGYHTAAACIAWSLLDAAAEIQHTQQQQQEPAAAAAAEGELSCSSGTADAAAAAMLPCVVILGRCCLMWAEHSATQSKQQQQQQQQQEWQQTSSSHEEQQQEPPEGSDNEYVRLNHPALLSVVQRWMAAGSTCDQHAVAGYVPLQVLQQQLLATEDLLQDESDESDTVCLAAAQQLWSIGLALCSFAVPCMCNNPGCTSMAVMSELASVSGRSCICGGCRLAHYCGRACQRAAWKQHKPVCGALSAAAASSSAVADSTAGAAAAAAGTTV